MSRKVRWSIQARAGRINPEIVRLLKTAGCCLVEIGVEAGTQHELDRVNKGATVEMNMNAVRLCRKAGIEVHVYMLMGLEDESISDLEQRLAWVKRARPTSFQWGQVVTFPGTPLYQAKGNAFFERSEWTQAAVTQYYATQNLSGITIENRRAWMARHFSPYARWHWWKDALRRYPLRTLAMLILSKLRRRIRRGL
ncbi:MAG: radical SAM protein [Planctomycetes bacterium]|nr:radical SAM protein [Planctomycetota bacterium]